MSIKYNEFGEVISVNGLTTGQHLGAPMQDAIAEKPEDNKTYGEELATVTRVKNVVEDKQPNSSGGVNSDWNQNDPTAPDYVKNRPFYSYIGETVVLSGELEEYEPGVYGIEVENTMSVVDGESVTITFNGATYEVTLFSNGYSFYGEHEDLTVEAEPNHNGIRWMWLVDAKSAGTVTITKIAEIVNKLDAKYRPFGNRSEADAYIKLPFNMDKFIRDNGHGEYDEQFRLDFYPRENEAIHITKESFDALRAIANSEQYTVLLSQGVIGELYADSKVVYISAKCVSYDSAYMYYYYCNWYLSWDEDAGVARLSTSCTEKKLVISTSN